MNKTIIYDFKDVQKGEHSEEITKTTANTWQPNREFQEKLSNTQQGKFAENAVKKFIDENCNNVVYLPYDNFRADGFKKNAPFDGLIYNKTKVSNETLKNFLEKINYQVSSSTYGKISNTLFHELEINNIYTVEIKSTQVNEAKHTKSGIMDFDDPVQRQHLIDLILNDDFLTYPHYIRSGDMSWLEYCEYCKTKNCDFKNLHGDDLCEAVKTFELSYMDNFYVRCYLDYRFEKILIMGYIDKEELLNPPLLKKMRQWNKSENALYFAKCLKYRKTLQELIETLS